MSQINSDIMRHLSYSKSIYLHALQHSDSGSVSDRAISIVNFDGAIEMFLYALMEHAGSEIPNNADFYSLINDVRRKLTELNLDTALLQEVSIKNMHRARNQTQHHGIIPSVEDIQRYRTMTYKVLSNLSESILKRRFEEISLSELIQDNFVKTLYKKGEEAYFSSNYENALIYIATAFERAKTIEQGKLWGSGMLWAKLGLNNKDDKSKQLFELLISELEILKLRLDYKKYQKYRETFCFTLIPFTTLQSGTSNDMVNEVKTLIAQAIPVWRVMDSQKLKNTTTFCLAFVLDSILAWEVIPRVGWRS